MYNKEELIESVERVLNFNIDYEINEDSVPQLIEKWSKNKSKFITMFGDKLMIKTKDIVVEKSVEEKKLILSEFIHDITFFNFRYDISTGNICLLQNFLKGIKIEEFFLNCLLEDYEIEMIDKDNKVINLTKGTKLSRCFKHFINNKDALEKIQNKYSMILQDVKVSGDLVLSVHPLDYLSISDNNHNWYSCHSLDGEYGAGNLGYMTDKVTIVAYLATDKEVEITGFGDLKWNSKKWRMLFYIDENNNIIAGSKNYPFKSDSLTKQAFEFVQELIGENKTWSDLKEIDALYNPHLFIEDAEDTVHFNDCLRSSTHKGWISSSNKYNEERIVVGEPVLCLDCNKNYVTNGETNYSCCSCAGFISCCYCGYNCPEDELYYLYGDFYCPECAHDNFWYCDSCCQYFKEEETFFNEETCECFCLDCLPEDEEI